VQLGNSSELSVQVTTRYGKVNAYMLEYNADSPAAEQNPNAEYVFPPARSRNLQALFCVHSVIYWVSISADRIRPLLRALYVLSS